MADILNLFPQRAAIGRVDARGNVYMTDEFTRALAALLMRVGGPNGNNLGDIAAEVATGGNAAALHLGAGLEAIEHQLAQAEQLTARLAELRKQVAALEAVVASVTPPTDWEHPGAIGVSTPAAGRFTTLKALTVNGVKIEPGGLDSLLHLEPGSALWVVAGKSLTVQNVLGLAGVDGSTLNIGHGGTLGSAAYVDAGTLVARTNAGLGGPATDAATTQTLANNIRAALLSVGLGA